MLAIHPSCWIAARYRPGLVASFGRLTVPREIPSSRLIGLGESLRCEIDPELGDHSHMPYDHIHRISYTRTCERLRHHPCIPVLDPHPFEAVHLQFCNLPLSAHNRKPDLVPTTDRDL